MDKLYLAEDYGDMFAVLSKAQDLLLRQVLNLKYDMERNTGHTLIRSISGRLKSLEGIQSKLRRLNLPVSPQSACENLHDIVGIRIICSYLDDIPVIIDSLRKLDLIDILEERDYISHPKASGYRSMHVIIRIHTWAGDVLGEIQIRTTAMDSWAALEHQMRYKKNLAYNEYVNKELLEVAELLYETDQRMQNIFQVLQSDPEETDPAIDDGDDDDD